MRKIIRNLLASALFSASCLNASLAVPVGKCFFSEDFFGYDTCSKGLPAGWSAFGAGKTAVGSYAGSIPVTAANRLMRLDELFPDNTQPYVMLDLKNEGVHIPYCNTSTKEGGSVDEWLITPVINTSDASKALLLSFDVVLFGSNKPAPVAVYIASSDAKVPKDFSSGLLYSGSHKGSPKEVRRERVYVALPHDAVSNRDGIRLAFVCTASGAQLVGFTDFCISEYEISMTNHTPEFTMDKGTSDVSLSMEFHYPEKCDSLTCTLETDDGEKTFNCEIVGSSALDFSVDVTFNDVLQLDYTSDLCYDVVVRPQVEDAVPYTQQFRIVCRKGFPSVCVIEEATGAWCPSCVRGIAAFEKYEAQWGKRFIGIAVHNRDSMAVEDYDSDFRNISGINYFPCAWFNRTIADNPISEEVAEGILAVNSAYRIAVNAVCLNTAKDTMTVDFEIECCRSFDSARLSVAFVVLQEDYVGFMQNNGYSGCTQQSVGDDWWPYFSRFSSAAETISPFVFNHVARGIFPNVYGDAGLLPTSYIQDSPVRSVYTFRMPEMLGKEDNPWSKSSLVALLIDTDSGEIVAADKMEGADYAVSVTGIETTNSLPIPVAEYYTDMSGRKTLSPVSGRCYLKTIVYKDGGKRTVKKVFQ